MEPFLSIKKTSLDPDKPVISRKIGARTVIKPREQPLLEIRREVHRDCWQFLPFSERLRYEVLPSHFRRKPKPLPGISKASNELYAITSDKAGGTNVRHDGGRRYYV